MFSHVNDVIGNDVIAKKLIVSVVFIVSALESGFWFY